MRAVDAPVPTEHLAAPARRLHRALLTALLRDGVVPPVGALADTLGIDHDALAASLRELVVGDYAALGPAGELRGLYPLSAVPTPHVVVIDGHRRHAMCAIDALGLPAMLGRELTIGATCGLCHAPIRLVVRPGTVVATEPATATVVARRDEHEPAANACCPATVFACGAAHGRALIERLPGTSLLSLP